MAQGASLSLFSNREAEFEQRAQLLKRLSFTIFCSEVDQYVKAMPDIQGETLHFGMIEIFKYTNEVKIIGDSSVRYDYIVEMLTVSRIQRNYLFIYLLLTFHNNNSNFLTRITFHSSVGRAVLRRNESTHAGIFILTYFVFLYCNKNSTSF